VKNPISAQFCELLDGNQHCRRCKWNQYFANDETSLFYNDPHLKLDYGIYADSKTGIQFCTSNTQAAVTTLNVVANCRQYNSSGYC